MMVRRALLAAVLLRTAAAIQVVEDPGGLAEHKEAEGRHLSRKERAVAERKARRKEAAMRAVEGSKKPGTSASQGEATGQAAGAVEGSKKPGASAAQGEAEGQSAGAEHWEAQGKPLSRKARAVAERRARREEAKRTAKEELLRERVQGRPQPAPEPTPAPTLATPAPTPEPTPEPTYTMDLPGVPCQCEKPSCFNRYDLDENTCITQAECDFQAPLLGNCTTVPATYGPTVWDLDGDGCLNYTEWDIIFDATNGSVCPTDVPTPCDECPEGYTVVSSPCGCEPCVGGEVRRRRALECTPCPSPLVDKGDFDDCKDPYTPEFSNGTNNSANITVTVPFETCDTFSLGDSITISGTDRDGNPASHTTIVMGITPTTGGFILDLLDPLTSDFAADASVRETCSSTDGTEVSSKNSPFAGGCCCACGTDCCETTEVCTVYPDGTGACSRAGPYPLFPTPAPTVGAKGDPHLVNLQGEHFDINHEGKFTLLRFPQAAEKSAEFSLQAAIQPDVGKPCTTYITQVELSGTWLGDKAVQIRCYRRSHSNDTDAFLGARLLEGESDSPWQTIEAFQSKYLVLSDSESQYEVSLDKVTWFPKKRSKKGPTAAGMFTLTLRNKKSHVGAKITMRQDLPEQEHLNVAVRQLSQLGRVDVGGLLGFDAHPQSLERPSAACVHHRATARYHVESQDEADHGYYFRPAWKDRWDRVRRAGRSRDNEAAASLMGKLDEKGNHGQGSGMCKCSSEGSSSGSFEGVLVEEASFVFAEASWE
ncbi:unnamed protein product [Prorocentrum cordatum]|uniref:HYR domain-containing protein n=1 Tax=Prorocentrum cordatum TaxID=2364126 RepID=A0ABN9SPY9_9DINO|nr:unnamed protein product [Polarella glacialis]